VPTTSPVRSESVNAVAAILRQYRPVVDRLLAGTSTTAETFVAQVANACRSNPDLWRCDPETVLGAALRCAQLNLTPNDGTSQAFIIPYGKTATFQIGYVGVLELARRAAPGLTFDGRPVYPNDEWFVDYGDLSKFSHVPHDALELDRGGEARLWYVVATYENGRRQVHHLNRDGVEYHRQFSKQKDGLLWTRSYNAAALKSVVVDMRRFLPVSRELAQAIAADAAVVDVRTLDDDTFELDTPQLDELPAELDEPDPEAET
jgi:recombination protein RecT